MINIDGASGGGQILRTAIGLSAITNKPIKITNIRGARSHSKGLMTQHLEGVLAVAQLCNAEVKGAKLGSMEIEFIPKSLENKKLNIRISTAGSIGLLYQSLQIPSAFTNSTVEIHVKGGSTASAWSPTVHYIQNIFLQLVKKMGYVGEIKIMKEAFYPKGGAEVEIFVHPIKKLNPIQLLERGKIKCIKGVSIVGSLPKNVAERQNSAAIKTLKDYGFDDINISSETVTTLSPGTSITLWAEFENSIIGADNIGRRGVRAEIIGEECAKSLIKSIESGAALDKYMADQILPFMAISDGKCLVTVEEITDHCRTNISVCEQILGCKFEVDEKNRRIEVDGIGLENKFL